MLFKHTHTHTIENRPTWGRLTFCRMGVGQVLSNRTELKIPYTPSLRWYTMVLGVEPFSSVGRGGVRGSTSRGVKGWEGALAPWEAQQGRWVTEAKRLPLLQLWGGSCRLLRHEAHVVHSPLQLSNPAQDILPACT